MELTKLFIEDSIEKKVIARGANNRASRKRGFRGAVLMPHDILSASEKRKRTMESKKIINSYNMYDTIIEYSEFKKLDERDKARHVKNYRLRFTAKEIALEWKISTTMFYNIQKKLNVLKDDNFMSEAKKRKLKKEDNKKTKKEGWKY